MATPQSPDQILDGVFVLGGVVALAFGATLLLGPETARSVSALLLGLWWLIHSAFLTLSVLIDRQDAVWRMAIAVLGAGAGLAALSSPVQTEEFLDSPLSITLGVIGVAVAGVALYGGFRGGGMGSMLFGVVSGAIGALLLAYPDGSFAMLVTVVGVILAVHGITAVVMALNARETPPGDG